MIWVSPRLALPRISLRILGFSRDFVNSFIFCGLASLNICEITFPMLLTGKGILHI